MLLTWTWLLALMFLAGQGEAQSCKPDLQGIVRNLASGRPACQSSVVSHPLIPSASKAVDGNCDGDFARASCTLTKFEKEPWWRVDLGDQYAITTVVLKSCLDCWCESLQGAEIHVGNSIADHGKSNPLCGNVTDPIHGSISTIFCQKLKGRYVSVNLPGRRAALSLCELEVYGTKPGAKMLLAWTWLLPLVLLAGRGEAQSSEPDLESTTVAPALNLARGRPACQSSTMWHTKDPSAGKAVDGNSDGAFFHGSCTHTISEDGPWWHVDLGDRYAISSVVVTNRADCCSNRLVGAQIRVGDHVIDHGKFNPLCGVITDFRLGSISTFHCQGMKGRYVSVNHPGEPATLTLCEVEVYGTKLEDENAATSVVLGTCTHTQLDKEPWWHVDLGEQFAISAVVVKNRGDCCGKRLQGAEIRVGDSVADRGKSNHLCGTITDTSLGSVSTLYCNWLKGRYVSIHIPGRAEYLTLCEVEVYGTKAEDQC
ncbi:uncharacterized protein LOC118089697 [Zootoca vivipara]|uniref:uncharacterized protein LOC118089697 n=1 Tax=Zootoca vivipara TaxID=8524 RepID=UPI00293BF67D|nr:uncharacterized protein LOC118089697 [Zootoca vivipara]